MIEGHPNFKHMARTTVNSIYQFAKIRKYEEADDVMELALRQAFEKGQEFFISKSNLPKRVELENFVFDSTGYSCRDRGKSIHLTAREFELGWFLFCHPSKYISRRLLSDVLWHSEADVVGKTLEQHMYKLRIKLKLSVDRGITIRSVYRKGYILEHHTCGS